MSQSIYLDREARQWVLPNGRRIPVIAGAEGEGDDIVVPVNTPETTPPPAQAPAPAGRTFTEDDIEKARREEKEKLYPQLETLKEKLERLEKEREEREAAEAEERRLREEENRRREEEELSAKELLQRKEREWEERFNSVQSEWEQRLTAVQEEAAAKEALLQKEREFQQLEAYKQRRIQEEADNLAPQLLHFIVGDTPEAIEAAISSVAAATSAIVNDIQQSSRQLQRPIPATGQAPSTSPTENTMGQKTYTVADLQAMDMATYAAQREALLAAASRRH